jgi:hypothetical protein
MNMKMNKIGDVGRCHGVLFFVDYIYMIKIELIELIKLIELTLMDRSGREAEPPNRINSINYST